MIDYKDTIQEFHKWTIFYKTSKFPKAIKNFETSKYNEHRSHFENFARIVNRNYGHIDYKLYIQSLAEFFKGWFNPRYLGHPKGTKIYKNYIDVRNMKRNKEDIKQSVIRSLQFVIKYMIENDLKTLDDYMSEGQYLIPTIAKHYSAGSICPYFLALIKDIKTIIHYMPLDIKRDYFDDFLNDYGLYRAKVINNLELAKISDKLDEKIEKFINNNRKNKQNKKKQ